MRRWVLIAKNWLFELYGACSLLVLTRMHQLETLFIVLLENQWEDTLFQGSPELFSPSVKRRALGSRLWYAKSAKCACLSVNWVACGTCYTKTEGTVKLGEGGGGERRGG